MIAFFGYALTSGFQAVARPGLRSGARRGKTSHDLKKLREAALDDVISGAYVFTGERSTRSYALNKMANSLSSPENRARFQADEVGYMGGRGCSDTQIDLVRRRDWKGMMEHGASIYLLLKIGAAVGVALPEIGAHTAGRTPAEHNARKGH